MEVSKAKGDWMDSHGGRVSVAEWSERWYISQVQIKPTAASGYRHSFDKLVNSHWGKARLPDVTHAAVQKWVSELSTRLAPSTVRQIHLVFSVLMKFAFAMGDPPRAQRRTYAFHV